MHPDSFNVEKNFANKYFFFNKFEQIFIFLQQNRFNYLFIEKILFHGLLNFSPQFFRKKNRLNSFIKFTQESPSLCITNV